MLRTLTSNLFHLGAEFQAQHSPSRSLPRRTLSFLLRATLGGIVFFTAGSAAALYLLPNGNLLLALLRKPVTNADTLSLFEPDDDLSREINEKIVHCSLAETLRKDPRFEEARPHLKIPPEVRPTSLTGGTLAGPGRIAVPPLMFSEDGGKSMVSIFYLGEQLCGHPGIVHGGMLATILDEGLARACFPALPNRIGMTANLSIDYRKPSRAPGYFVLRAYTTRVEGRKAWVHGWIEPLRDDIVHSLRDAQTVDGVKIVERPKESMLVEGQALFVEPKNVDGLSKMIRDKYT